MLERNGYRYYKRGRSYDLFSSCSLRQPHEDLSTSRAHHLEAFTKSNVYTVHKYEIRLCFTCSCGRESFNRSRFAFNKCIRCSRVMFNYAQSYRMVILNTYMFCIIELKIIYIGYLNCVRAKDT